MAILRALRFPLGFMLATFLVSGCCLHELCHRRPPTPTEAGLNTNDLVDPTSQFNAANVLNQTDLNTLVTQATKNNKAADPALKRSILCLSGGGSHGAYSAGILCGWSTRGDRPVFDVVTGVSTGGLIAPFAFLGPEYDDDLQRFYTTLSNRDIYRLKPVVGIVSESLANNAPLAREIERTLTCEMIRDIAKGHRQGRRLYLGTTESEGRRFIVWDIGEIAARGGPDAKELIKQIMLGSSAIPGFFPPSEIPVTVDGKTYIEKHVDGGVSYSIFMRPPMNLPDEVLRSEEKPLAGSDVYAVIAGKLYAEPEVTKPFVLRIAAKNISTLTYAQTRADLVRLWTVCAITGMNFHMTSIPESLVLNGSSKNFDPIEMQKMFAEGYDRVLKGDAWRTTPPGTEPGEDPLIRSSTNLAIFPRGESVTPIQK